MDVDASPSATPEPDATSRRRSRRVVKVPAKFAPEPAVSAAPKRKRDEDDGQEAEDDEMDPDEDINSDDDNDDAESDGDHPAPRSRKAGARVRKPSSKKPKMNGAQPAGPNQVSRIPSRPKKAVRIEAGEKGSGLFGTWILLPRGKGDARLCLGVIQHGLTFLSCFGFGHLLQRTSSDPEILQTVLPNYGWKNTKQTTLLRWPISSTLSSIVPAAIWRSRLMTFATQKTFPIDWLTCKMFIKRFGIASYPFHGFPLRD